MNALPITMPKTIYLIATEFQTLPGFPIASAGDWSEDLDGAADQAVECNDDAQPWRAFRMDFCVETNAPEAFQEVTEEVQAVINDRTDRVMLLMAAE